MSTGILITLCVLLLIAYIFDISASRTRIPAVILLLGLGWVLRQITDTAEFALPDLSPVLPILGTIGLIMIVLEGSLELDLQASNLRPMRKAAMMAIAPLILLAFGLAWVVSEYFQVSFLLALTNTLPLAIISSAIAIPTASGFSKPNKEFVIFESSLSDVVGVLIFNFVSLNEAFGWDVIGEFGFHLLLIVLISFVATAALSFLLSRIQHHVKFAPIILLVILIYAISKIYHLPGLIMIMAFGMFLGNLDQLKRFKRMGWLRPESLEGEVHKLKELLSEGAFLVRSLFFLLFGFQIETAALLDGEAFLWAMCICVSFYLLRLIFLKVLRMPASPLIFIAPRGLITVLLFLSIPASRNLPLFGTALITQVVLISSLMMMFGTIWGPKGKSIPASGPQLAEDSILDGQDAHEDSKPEATNN